MGARVLLYVVIGYATWLGVLFLLQRSMLFPRHWAAADPAALKRHPGIEVLSLEIPEGRVEAWLLPGEGVGPESPGPAVIFAHGNAELIDGWPDWLADYRRLGITVLIPEYRGYGRSSGTPSQEAIVSDFVRFHDLLASREEIDPRRIVFHGRSLGGGVVCALARERRPAALVLQSTFASVRLMARGYLAPGFLVRDPFDSEAVLSSLEVPVLLGHGRRDGVIPFTHARRLQRAARRAELIEWDSDHNDAPPQWSAYMEQIAAFLREHGILTRGG